MHRTCNWVNLFISHTHFQKICTAAATGWTHTVVWSPPYLQPGEVLITHFLKLWYSFYIRICVCEKLAPYHLDRPDRKSPTPADSTVLFGRNSMLPVLIHAQMKKIKIHLATSLGQVECKQSRRCFRCFLWQSKGNDVRISFSSVEKCPHLASNSFWLLSNGRFNSDGGVGVMEVGQNCLFQAVAALLPMLPAPIQRQRFPN